MPNAGQIVRASDVPRVVAFGVITANTSNVTVETVALTLGQASYQTGRAYRGTIKGLIACVTSGDEAAVRARRGTTTAGQAFLDTFAIRGLNNTNNYPFFFQGYFTPTSNFTDSFCMTIGPALGGGGVRIAASATQHVGYFAIEDMGAGSLNSYPGIISV